MPLNSNGFIEPISLTGIQEADTDFSYEPFADISDESLNFGRFDTDDKKHATKR